MLPANMSNSQPGMPGIKTIQGEPPQINSQSLINPTQHTNQYLYRMSSTSEDELGNDNVHENGNTWQKVKQTKRRKTLPLQIKNQIYN